MKISEMQLYSALNEFIDREIMPLGASMDYVQQLLYGVKIGVIKRRAEVVIKKYLNKPEIKMLEIVDENGLIDIAPIYESAMDTMSKMQKLEIGGITFKPNDLQNLYSILQRHAG
jgi:hypothetical protein